MENGVDSDDGDVHEFKTYLKTRPASLETRAIEMITRVAQKYDRYNFRGGEALIRK